VVGVVVLLGAVAMGLTLWGVVGMVRRELDVRLGPAAVEIRRLADDAAGRDRGAEIVRGELSAFRQALADLRVREEERRGREEEAWTALHRVSAVLAGSHAAGRAGENVLSESFAHLPPAMLVRDFRVNGRVVEFGLLLPDGRRLPIDSKWPAQRELAALSETRSPEERNRLVRLVEKAVADRSREVAGYLDPAVTAPLAVAAVPDAAYAVLRKAHADAYRQGVVVIPYSMALPVVLFLHGIVSRFGAVGDVEACLAALSSLVTGMEATLENKVAKAATMLANGADELRGQMGKARTTLASARRSEVEVGAPAVLVDPGDPDGPQLVRVG
jgi:DNA recombination protein RmuC